MTATIAPPPDTTPPTVASIVRHDPASSPTNADTLIWRVTFSEPVTGVDTADFAVAGTTATATLVSPVTGMVEVAYDVTASGGNLAALTATATLSFVAVHGIVDAANNALTDTAPTGDNEASYVVDNTAPTVTRRGCSRRAGVRQPATSVVGPHAHGDVHLRSGAGHGVCPGQINPPGPDSSLHRPHRNATAIRNFGNDAASFTTGQNSVGVTNSSTEAPIAPGVPTGLTATAAGTTTINLSWTAPADNGGRVISGYKIEISPNGTDTWTDHAVTSGAGVSYATPG